MSETENSVQCIKCGKSFITKGVLNRLERELTRDYGNGEENQPPQWLRYCPACRKRETGQKLRQGI